MLLIHRKGYTRSDGTRVSPTMYASRNTGAPGRGPKLFTLSPGGLSRYGYKNILSSSPQKRHNALKRAMNSGVSKRTLSRRLVALSILTKRTRPAFSTAIRKDRAWMAQRNVR